MVSKVTVLAAAALFLSVCGGPDTHHLSEAVNLLRAEAPWAFDDKEGLYTEVYWGPLEAELYGKTVKARYGGVRWIIIDPKKVGEYLNLTVAHELGHAMGLAHSLNKESIMYPRLGELPTDTDPSLSLRYECILQRLGCSKLRVKVIE